MPERPSWKPEYSVRVEELDAQHKHLFSLIGKLFDAMAGANVRDISRNILSSLNDYAITHFSTEERLLLRFKYDDFSEQKREHDAFFDTIRDYEKNGSDTFEKDMLEFLNDWLSEHILKVDKKYATFLNNHGVK
ncbi:MAG: bacteriohemerythrin [Spirochaetota bacterium]